MSTLQQVAFRDRTGVRTEYCKVVGESQAIAACRSLVRKQGEESPGSTGQDGP